MALDPARSATRLAVRRDLPLLSDGDGGSWSPHVRDGGCVMVACSGGADSLALLAATIFEAAKAPFRVIGVTVDHGLQEGARDHAAAVVAQMAALGADETASISVTVDPGPSGIEAGAREARYAALGQLAEHFSADRVLLGHTRDDQAETVLLGLTRGSGGRSIAGMRRGWHHDEGPSKRVIVAEGQDEDGRTTYLGHDQARFSTHFSRPMLDLTREQTEAACRADDIDWWVDPHNSDPRFVRARIRHIVMPMLERELGPGFAAALARTADQVREDVEYLDFETEMLLQEVRVDDGYDTSRLETIGLAVKHRLIRMAVLEAGALASDLTREHIWAVSQIVYGVDEGKQIQLPGHVTAYRTGNVLRFRPTNG